MMHSSHASDAPRAAASAERRRRDKHGENDATDCQCLHGWASILAFNQLGLAEVPASALL
jgi:hypothetical protein